MQQTEVKCVKCGSIMKHDSTQQNQARYVCPCCGNKAFKDVGVAENSEYLFKRSELIARVRDGIIDWQTVQWDYLRRDIQDFIKRHDEAQHDMQLKMCIIACLTNGYHMMDKEQYVESKAIFKVTEKVYKRQLKMMKLNMTEEGIKKLGEYEQERHQYIQCRNEYRCRKFYWKAVFTVLKMLIPK